MDNISLFTLMVIVVLGIIGIIYFFFTLRFFNNWNLKYKDEKGRKTPIFKAGLFMIIFAIPPIVALYFMPVFGPII